MFHSFGKHDQNLLYKPIQFRHLENYLFVWYTHFLGSRPESTLKKKTASGGGSRMPFTF